MFPKKNKPKDYQGVTTYNKHQNRLFATEKVWGDSRFFSKQMLSFLGTAEVVNLSQVSKVVRNTTAADRTLRAAQRMLQHVVLGEQTKACTMMKLNPGLLLIKSKALDYSGRMIIATPFQAAVGAGDKPMWEMMLPYIDPSDALRQFKEWFPGGISCTSIQELQAYQTYYNVIALSIINDTDHGESAIETFRKVLSSQPIITQGIHFNLYHLIAAYQAFITHFPQANDFNELYKCEAFWYKVIGYVQRQMTAYDAQMHCCGLKSILDNESHFIRKFSYDMSKYKKFFPLEASKGFGFQFGCISYYDYMAAGFTGLEGTMRLQAPLKNYVARKQLHLQDLENHLSKEYVIRVSSP